MLSTPVLFLIYNRPDTTKAVFDQIKKAQPAKLFIAADGHRPHIANDLANCSAAREIVKEINWNCEVKTLFRDKNLGCKLAVSSAIAWFFEHVDEGIILEDDCFPDLSFFSFCDYQLKKHRDNPDVMMIAGTSYLPAETVSPSSYFFLRYFAIWGWATWKRAWQKYDITLSDWSELKKNNKLNSIFTDWKIVDFYTDLFDRLAAGNFDTWDIQWAYSCLFNNGVSISPVKNLVQNIATSGTHYTGDNVFLNREIFPFDLATMVEPETIVPDTKLEQAAFDFAISDGYRLIPFLRRKAGKLFRKIFK